MKHLYSTFAALLLILLTSIAGFAQRNNAKPKSVITRTIVGCTLGETTLEQIKEFFGEGTKISLSREISKKFEETKRGTIEELIEFSKSKTLKGEMVLVVNNWI